MNFAAGISRQDQKPFGAAMSTFSAALMRGRLNRGGDGGFCRCVD